MIARAVRCCHAVVFLAAVLLVETGLADSLPVKIFQAKNFSSTPVPAIRTPLGIPEDYKPWMAKLKNNQLLIVLVVKRMILNNFSLLQL